MTKFSPERDHQSELPLKQALRTELVLPEEAAAFLRTTVNVLATWRCTGRHDLPFVKLGRSVRYRWTDLEDFVAKRVVEGQ